MANANVSCDTCCIRERAETAEQALEEFRREFYEQYLNEVAELYEALDSNQESVILAQELRAAVTEKLPELHLTENSSNIVQVLLDYMMDLRKRTSAAENALLELAQENSDFRTALKGMLPKNPWSDSAAICHYCKSPKPNRHYDHCLWRKVYGTDCNRHNT